MSHPTELNRRSFVGGVAATVLASGLGGCGSQRETRSTGRNGSRVQSSLGGTNPSLNNQPSSMPGPFPGRVVEVGHSGAVFDGQRERTIVKAMIEHGMRQLVPDAESSVDAWRYFFQKGDRIGIKVVPVGKIVKKGTHAPNSPWVDLKRPGPISSYEVISQ